MKLLAGWIAIAMAAACGVHAQERYPWKPIQAVIPRAPGTTTDIVGRAVALKLRDLLGQPVVVQNRPGAGGTIGAQAVVAAPPDGYTLFMTNSQHSVNPALYAKLGYDTIRDFSGVAMIAESPALVYVNPALGVKTLRELISLARQKPGTLNYGSAGTGTSTHLIGALFANQAKVDIVHIPYKIGTEVISDLLANRIQLAFSPIAFMLPQVREGKLLALANTSIRRVEVLPDVPTVAEAGVPGFEASTWYGFLVSSKVPRVIQAQVAKAVQQVAGERDIRERFDAQGIVTRTLLLDDFDAYIKGEVERMGALVASIGARIQ
ncbi:MAG: tripartite tricarboxylate transporter substrate binding protein [Burkholderiales bacterium]